MFFKLALQNVKKSYRDYLIYFLTLAFSVCLFFTFNSFQEQQVVMEMNESQLQAVQSLSDAMRWLSIFVAIVLGFLILYANNFLIRKRKKEFGVYSLLGMQKSQVSRILIYETLCIGIASLVFGIILGVFLSQNLLVITASIFAIPLHYRFVFSTDAFILTIISFMLIFFITMMFNSVILRKYKLIDLLYADRKNDILDTRNLTRYVITFILAILCIGTAYWMTLGNGIEALRNLTYIIPLGSIGTVLFFYSLAGFLLRFVQKRKKLYYRNLNMFVLREVNSSIKSNFISMSVVCIMLLISIGTLSTGFSLNQMMVKTINTMIPYNYSMLVSYYQDTEQNKIEPINEDVLQSVFQINKDMVKSSNHYSVYESDLSMDEFANTVNANETQNSIFENNYKLPMMRLSDYNVFLKAIGKDEIHLKKDEITLYTTSPTLENDIQSIQKQRPMIHLSNKQVNVVPKPFEVMNLSTSEGQSFISLLLIVPDEFINETTQPVYTFINFNLNDDVDSKAFKTSVEEKFQRYIDTRDNLFLFSNTQEEIIDANKGVSVIVTYISIYIGIVFLLSSAVILALQQLSKASDNKKRYAVLQKMGVDKKMINRSIFLQLSIYFIVPLILAVIHSIVGIAFASNVIGYLGKVDVLLPSLITASIILLVYGSYFLITYIGYKNIIK